MAKEMTMWRVLWVRVGLPLLLPVVASASIGSVVVVSGASFEPGLPAKGSIATIFCTGLEGIEGVVVAKETPLPRELAGVRVVVGGAQAPIFAVAALAGYQQINIQVPQEADIQIPETFPRWPVGNIEVRTELVVERNGRRASVEVLLRKSPGDFFELEGGFAVLQHAHDYSLVTQENPAHPDEILVAYLTGMPGTSPVVPTAAPSPAVPLAIVPQKFSQLFDRYEIGMRITQDSGLSCIPEYVGLAPGLVGIYQVNFQLPGQARIFGSRQLMPFVAEMRLVRLICPSGDCQSPAIPSFYSRWVRIPIAPKLP